MPDLAPDLHPQDHVHEVTCALRGVRDLLEQAGEADDGHLRGVHAHGLAALLALIHAESERAYSASDGLHKR